MSQELEHQIPIWPGSGSFVPGDTPFGFYDTDAHFQRDADKVAVWCAKRLGYPIVNVELQDVNFYAAFEEAVTEYSNQVNQYNIVNYMLSLQGQSTGSNLTGREIVPNFGRIITIAEQYGTEAGVGGLVDYYTGSISVAKDTQVYDLEELYAVPHSMSGDMEIKRIFHQSTPAMVRYFDPYAGTGLGTQGLMDQFGWGNYSPGITFVMMPMYADLLRLQAIEFNDMIRRSQYSFDLINNKLRIFPLPTYDFTLYFQYVKKSERSNSLITGSFGTGVITDISNVPYDNVSYKYVNDVGKRWIFKYALAVVREVLGLIRAKYATIPFANNEEVQLDGDSLRTEAQQEMETLITELRETLEQLNQENLMEKRNTISEAMQSEFSKIPMPFFVG